MCWEQSRLKRTIATSRSDDNRDETETETTRRTKALARATYLMKPLLLPSLPLRSHLEENRFRLTNSFRNGPTRRRWLRWPMCPMLRTPRQKLNSVGRSDALPAPAPAHQTERPCAG